MKNSWTAYATAPPWLAMTSMTGAQTLCARDGRARRWEFGADLLYQNSHDVNFTGGSTVDLDSDIGLRFASGYHCSDRLQWLDVANATSTHDFDVVRIGLGYKY